MYRVLWRAWFGLWDIFDYLALAVHERCCTTFFSGCQACIVFGYGRSSKVLYLLTVCLFRQTFRSCRSGRLHEVLYLFCLAVGPFDHLALSVFRRYCTFFCLAVGPFALALSVLRRFCIFLGLTFVPCKVHNPTKFGWRCRHPCVMKTYGIVSERVSIDISSNCLMISLLLLLFFVLFFVRYMRLTCHSIVVCVTRNVFVADVVDDDDAVGLSSQDVEKQLPGKHEHVVMCRLSRRQASLYEEFMARSSTRSALQGGNFMGMMNVLMQLRKASKITMIIELYL